MNPGAAAWTHPSSAKSADASGALVRAWPAAAAVVATGAIVLAGVGVRVLFAAQFDGIDDAGYLDAAQRIASGRSLGDLFPLFRTRVGMAYPLGWLLQIGWLRPEQFWLLTLPFEIATMIALMVAGSIVTGRRSGGVLASLLYATYPLAIQQSMMFYPTAFQVASIAVACALVACAERSSPHLRIALGFAAGLSLGLGYLFKEDVAMVVPMIAIASVVARFPRPGTTAALCAGAACVFFAECFVYWQSTGHPLYRLSVTSGLGAPVGDQLRIAEIWRWDAYIRSLFLLPVQVGMIWWAALVAVIATLARGRRSGGAFFIAVLFVLVMAYLQFGSGSLSSYSPLPKTPRYTALVTPLLMLAAGGWIARMLSMRPRWAVTIGGGILIAALPCLFFLQLSSSERTRNTLAVLPVLRQLRVEDLYTDYYSARILRLLAPQATITTWYHAKFDVNEMVVVNDPRTARGAFVLLDRQAAKIYTSSYELPLPASVDQPPSQWIEVWRHRAFDEASMTRRMLAAIRRLSTRLPGPLRVRIERSVADIIEGDDAVLFRLSPP